MCNKTRVVVSTVGPYSLYGTKLVSVCCGYGTDYVDITGEVKWVEYISARMGAVARQSGARIVSHCGHDSVPYDMLVLASTHKLQQLQQESYQLLQEHQNQQDQSNIQKVELFVEAQGGFSGGTLASIFAIMEQSKYKLKQSKYSLDNYYHQNQDGEYLQNIKQQQSNSINKSPLFMKYNRLFQSWTCFSVMSGCNFQVVKRSNRILNYSKKGGRPLIYKESMVNDGFLHSFILQVGLVFIGLAMLIQPLKYILKQLVLPKPGEGPTEQTMDNGYCNVFIEASDQNEQKVYGVLGLKGDPGYKATARMLAESALCFVYQEVKVQGGFYTTASAFGEGLLHRLVQTGSTFQFYHPYNNNNNNNKHQ